jgi:hypothetical protein
LLSLLQYFRFFNRSCIQFSRCDQSTRSCPVNVKLFWQNIKY